MTMRSKCPRRPERAPQTGTSRRGRLDPPVAPSASGRLRGSRTRRGAQNPFTPSLYTAPGCGEARAGPQRGASDGCLHRVLAALQAPRLQLDAPPWGLPPRKLVPVSPLHADAPPSGCPELTSPRGFPRRLSHVPAPRTRFGRAVLPECSHGVRGRARLSRSAGSAGRRDRLGSDRALLPL